MNAPPRHLPAGHAQLRSLLPGLMLGPFMAALDQTIVAAALPAIARQLSGAELLAWVVSGYLLAMTVATPLFGKLGDQLGRRRMLAVALRLFVLASMLCALARDMGELVAARLLQGIGLGGAVGVATLSSRYWLLSPGAPDTTLELAGGALANEAFRQLLMLNALVALRLEDRPLRRA